MRALPFVNHRISEFPTKQGALCSGLTASCQTEQKTFFMSAELKQRAPLAFIDQAAMSAGRVLSLLGKR